MKKRRKIYDLSNWLLFLGVILLFTSRILVSLFHFPTFFNFLHYGIILFAYFLYIIENNHNKVSTYFIFVVILFVNLLFSSILNSSGVINFLLDFMLLGEVIFAADIFEHDVSMKNTIAFNKLFRILFTINVLFVLIQYFVFSFRTDEVQGIFLGMGAGAHICGAINILAIIFYFQVYRKTRKKINLFLILINIFSVIVCDNKQSMVAFIASIILMVLFDMIKNKKRNHVKTLILVLIIVVIYYFLMAELYPTGLGWLNADYLVEGIEKKFQVFTLLSDSSGSVSLFGNGPGMTIGRLAQMLPDYEFLIGLGGKTSNVYDKLWDIQQSNWITNNLTGSSFFSLFFSYSGIYGDLGLFGLFIFIFLLMFLCNKFKNNRYALVVIFFYFIHGFIFQWLEEPNFAVGCFSMIYILKENQRKDDKLFYDRKYPCLNRSGL